MNQTMQYFSHSAPTPEGALKKTAQAFSEWQATRPGTHIVKTDVTITRPGLAEWIVILVVFTTSDQDLNTSPPAPPSFQGGLFDE